MAADSRKTRKSNFSSDEISVLISTIMHNYDILYGETSKSSYHKEARSQVWNIVLEEVNKVSLDRRTLAEVKNKWKKCQYVIKNSDLVDNNTSTDFDELDSMPLQQRLSQNTSHCIGNNSVEIEQSPSSEPVLQSQPISPTKLKVTRQSAKPHIHNTKSSPTPPVDKVYLKWDSHHTNMQLAFPNLLLKEQYVDATLVSEGQTLKCHRMILSSCSPYFEEILSGISPLQHPVLFMKDIPFWILKALCDFMYAGEVHIVQEHLEEFIAVGNVLKIKGLIMSKDHQEDMRPIGPIEIKQEIDAVPMVAIKKEENTSRSIREEKQDLKQEVRSRRREDRKTKHQNQIIKEALAEDTPRKLIPKLPQKMVQKVVQKVLPKVCNSKSSVRNVSRSSTSKSNKEGSKRNEKHKQENLQKEKEKEKPLKKNEHINDPLDLLEPVYEEIAKEEPPFSSKTSMKNINPAKFRESKGLALKKGIKKTKEETTRKKVKKRRYAEYDEDRDESPSPTFQSRKGTRSRPNVKIPKYFHTSYEDSPKETTDATIVRVPHTDQNDPLIEADMSRIKAEPLDMEENTIEVEDNIVNYITQEMTSQECEEIIGSYDSPIVNIQRGAKRNAANYFKKMVDPVIMDVHTVTESEQSDISLINISNETVEIIDVADITSHQSQLEDTMDRSNCDPLSTLTDKTSSIKISNVQTVTEDGNSKKDEFFETSEQALSENIDNNSYIQETEEIEPMDESSNTFEYSIESLHISESEMQEPIDNTSADMNFKIESVVSQSRDLSEKMSEFECSSLSIQDETEHEESHIEDEYSESIDHSNLQISESQINLDIDGNESSTHMSDTERLENSTDTRINKTNDLEKSQYQTNESEITNDSKLNLKEPVTNFYNYNDNVLTNFNNKDLTDNENQDRDDQPSQLTTNPPVDQKNEESDMNISQSSINIKENKFTEEITESGLLKSLPSTSKVEPENIISNALSKCIKTSICEGDISDNTASNNIVSKHIVASVEETPDLLTNNKNKTNVSENNVCSFFYTTNFIEKTSTPNKNVTNSQLSTNAKNKQDQMTDHDSENDNIRPDNEKKIDTFNIPDFVNFSTSSPLQPNFLEENLLAQSPQTTGLTLPSDCTDNNQLEESLLELEDDVITSNEQPVQDNTEKTLEMIVNDLNESLGTTSE